MRKSVTYHQSLELLRRLWVGVVLLGLLVACQDAVRAQEQSRVALEAVVSGLERPVAVTHAGDGSGRLFITEQIGRVVVVDGASQSVFLDVSELVSCCGERGLLSVAFHPEYAENGLFFVYYTDKSGDSVIARYRVSEGDKNVADASSGSIILSFSQPEGNHNGGQLAFGPDGYLYIGSGDGGGGGDRHGQIGNGQALDTLLGKLLRIDVNTDSGYVIPADNPFVNNANARDEIWAYGLRNPWRFSFDSETGDLLIGDVGQNKYEEINYQPASSTGGENYGWRVMEATHCFNPASNCNTDGLTLPVLEYAHDAGCSVTGGVVYRGDELVGFDGVYVFGDYCSGTIWQAEVAGLGMWSFAPLLSVDFNVSAFGEDEAGRVYLADLNGGVVHRLVVAP